jgi:DNA polymerase-3 subunit gamma/tau
MALYRTYRPGRLADVIGQPHVTEPLARALDTGRVHHAYLFTGPRGCGKTSTARILARSLNCVKGPTSEPCGVCQSCLDLAPDGPGSIDVVEMDAATHGLVDDARDLREKAMYAPVASRYKIYIIDEAHQLSTGAANALLKLIEEPPPQLRFVFATTEPDKIISTIRSRTHQYPFRLVSLRHLQEHLAWVCVQEGVPAEPGALTLIARASQGSVRDSQSILGQLIAGSGEAGVTYDEAVGQLGFTDVALLDQAVEALAAVDGASLFGVVERVVEGGIDPRRFATDLLERLRDLLVLHQVPDAIDEGLLDLPDAQLDAVRRQGESLGLGQLSRAADLVSAGLSELKGATAPRLQLELLCARLLLPAVDDSDSGVLARLDRVERQMAYVAQGGPLDATGAPTTTPPPATAPRAPAPATTQPVESPAEPPAAPVAAAAVVVVEDPDPSTESPAASTEPSRRARAAAAPAAPARPQPTASSGPPRRPQPSDARPVTDGAPVDEAPQDPPASSGDLGASGPSLESLRSSWPAILEAMREKTKVGYSLAQGTVPVALHGRTLAVGHPDPNRMGILLGNKGHLGLLTLAILDVAQAEVEVDVVLGVGTAGTSTTDASTQSSTPGGGADSRPAPSEASGDAAPTPSPASRRPEAARRTPPRPEAAEDEAAPDDPEVADSDLAPLALIQRELGGNVVEEFDRPS